MPFVLSSPVFHPGQRIPEKFTRDDENISPPLAWSGAPAEALSFVIVCFDTDAPRGRFYHWGLYNVPGTVDHLKADFVPEPGTPAVQATNDFGMVGYGGPAPPFGSGTHHYEFHIYALGVERLHLPYPTPARELEQTAQLSSVGHARLVGTFSH